VKDSAGMMEKEHQKIDEPVTRDSVHETSKEKVLTSNEMEIISLVESIIGECIFHHLYLLRFYRIE
jgi:hypothetical protein